MAEDLKFPFKMYSVQGDGIICTGFHERAMEIIEITSGKATVQIGTEFAEAKAGDFLYVPPTMVFKVEALEGEAGMRSMVFDSSIIEENMENFDTEIFYMFYVQSKNKIVVFEKGHPVYKTLAKYMQESYDEYVSKDVCYKLPIRANIYLMMTALLRYYCGSKNELDRMIYHNVMRLRPVITYIAEHYKEKIYIETLSDMITVSPDYFTKMFKDSIGRTPIDYINGIRINRAMQMLATTDTSVNDISDGLGFSNANYFHKIFKQYMNTSPVAYRKMVKM
jgi:YesN/AraC family two-component response regulator